MHGLVQIAAGYIDVALDLFEPLVRDDESKAAGMGDHAPDHQVHPVRQTVTVAAGFDELAALDQVRQEPVDDGTLFAGYLEALKQLARGGRMVDFFTDQPQELFVVQHSSLSVSPLFPTRRQVAESTDCVTGTGPEAATDLDLVRLAQAGDIEAFGELVERNRRAVFRAALAAVRSPSEADDVAQEAFITAFRKLGSFRGESQFRTWLLSITWRKAIDRRKSLSRWLRIASSPPRDEAGDELFDAMERMPSSGRSQEDTLVDEELQRNVTRLIGTLPRKLRDALLLAGTGEHTYEQISGMLGVPLGTVKWRVSEARRVLKKKLTALGYAYE